MHDSGGLMLQKRMYDDRASGNRDIPVVQLTPTPS